MKFADGFLAEHRVLFGAVNATYGRLRRMFLVQFNARRGLPRRQ